MVVTTDNDEITLEVSIWMCQLLIGIFLFFFFLLLSEADWWGNCSVFLYIVSYSREAERSCQETRMLIQTPTVETYTHVSRDASAPV